MGKLNQIEELKIALDKYISETINDPVIADFVKTVIKSKEDKFLTLPAAVKYHHVYVHGLLMHTLEIAESIKWVIDNDADIVSKTTQKQKNILLAAAFLHDFAKTEKYEKGYIGFGYIDYTDNKWWKLKFNGVSKYDAICVTLSPMYIREAALSHEISNVDVNNICTLIQGHHGSTGWGSNYNVKCLPEDFRWCSLLFAADYASSRIFLEDDAIEDFSNSNNINKLGVETLEISNKIFEYLKSKDFKEFEDANSEDVQVIVDKALQTMNS